MSANKVEEYITLGEGTRQLTIFQHTPPSGQLTFDICTLPISSETKRVCSNLLPEQAKEIRDALDRWLAGGAL